jgi:hypothetical protein
MLSQTEASKRGMPLNIDPPPPAISQNHSRAGNQQATGKTRAELIAESNMAVQMSGKPHSPSSICPWCQFNCHGLAINCLSWQIGRQIALDNHSSLLANHWHFPVVNCHPDDCPCSCLCHPPHYTFPSLQYPSSTPSLHLSSCSDHF